MQRYLQYTGPSRVHDEHEAASAAGSADATDATAAGGGGGGGGGVGRTDASAPSAGSYLGMIRDQVFKTEAFARLLRSLTNLQPTGSKAEIRRFRPGLDYTVAHHGLLEKEFRLDATLCFADNTDVGAAMWDSEEVGGFECYIPADDEETVASEVYVTTPPPRPFFLP